MIEDKQNLKSPPSHCSCWILDGYNLALEWWGRYQNHHDTHAVQVEVTGSRSSVWIIRNFFVVR